MSYRLRTALCVAVVGLLMSAALAWAAGRDYAGTVTPGGTVKLTTGLSKRKRVIKQISIQGVPLHCAATSQPVTPASYNGGQAAVTYRRFHFSSNGSDMGISVVVKGSFNANFSRATGTVRFTGSIYPYATGCDSGKDTWTAH